MQHFTLLVLLSTVASATVFYVPMFDFDGNLLETDGRFHIEHLVNNVWVPYNATLKEWADIQARGDKNYRVSPVMDCNRDFSDELGFDNFYNQVGRAVKDQNNYGSAYPILKAHIQHGMYCYVITARKHFASSLSSGVRSFLEASLAKDDYKKLQKAFISTTAPMYRINTKPGWYGERLQTPESTFDFYLRGCDFYGVGEPSWYARQSCNKSNECKASMVEELTKYSILFTKNNYTTVVSFLDDEEPNLSAVKDKMTKVLVSQYPKVCFRIYDTSNKKQAKMININDVCKKVPQNEDYEARIFLQTTGGTVINAY